MESMQVDDLVVTPEQVVANIKFSQEQCFELLKMFKQVGNHWQSFPTRIETVHQMVNKTTLENKIILVMFNVEFIDVLIRDYNILPNNLAFISDNIRERNFVENFYKVKSILINPRNFKDSQPVYHIADLDYAIRDLDMKFDLVFSNPPYNIGKSSGADLKIIDSVFDISKEMIFIHPATWLYDCELKDKVSNNVKSKINTKIKSITILPVNTFDDIQLPNKLDVIHIDKSHNGGFTMCEIGNQDYVLESIYDITPLGKEYSMVKPFFINVKKYIDKHGSMFDHTINVSSIPRGSFHYNDEWYCQLADAIGQPDRPEYYGFLLKDYEKNLGIRKSGLDEDGNPVMKIKSGKEYQEEPIDNSFKFATEQEAKNFINFCRTDFARFCLVISKKGKDLNTGQLKNVPWLDFKQEWDDTKLYAKFQISMQIQDIIKRFIPEYYGIK